MLKLLITFINFNISINYKEFKIVNSMYMVLIKQVCYAK